MVPDSDLQSLNSEDAITWSYFGPLMFAPPEARAACSSWLTEQLGLTVAKASACTIDLWRRIPHPDKSLPGGPELDIVLDGDTWVIFGESKWGSGEGTGEGVAKDKTQMQLRQEFLGKYGTSIYGGRVTSALSITREIEDSGAMGGQGAAHITWAALADYPDHPASDEFSRYLAWKNQHSTSR